MFHVALTVISLKASAVSFYPIFGTLGGMIPCPQRPGLPFTSVSPQGAAGSWTGFIVNVQWSPTWAEPVTSLVPTCEVS